MFTKDETYTRVAELVDRFDEQFASYKKVDYNETLTRRLRNVLNYNEQKVKDNWQPALQQLITQKMWNT